MATAKSSEIAKKYAKALCHLNYARRAQRLGLILGSGVSYPLQIPKWNELIKQIESRLDYQSRGGPESYRAEQLFQLYRKKRIKELGQRPAEELEAAVTADWRGIVTRCLFKNFRSKNGRLNEEAYRQKIEQHPYLRALAELAQSVPLVITHNFDDALEAAIDRYPATRAPSNRRYHSFWKPELFLRFGMVNIYHPNGHTPLRRGRKGSENLILTETSFADNLVNVNTEESHFLLRHLADKTWLIIGHSLADSTLKNALRQHAIQRPGHVNYYVHWSGHGEADLTAAQRIAIQAANFETYNLVTIFASSSEIADCLKLILMEEDELEGRLARGSMDSRYVYYIVGAVSAGKSTTLRNLRDLATVEEWPDDMPAVMNRQSVGLNESQEAIIDAKLENGIWIKNCEIRGVKAGIVVVDRAPLDFIAFPTKQTETLGSTARRRANAVLQRLQSGNLRDLCSGQVIVIRAAVDVLVQRELSRGGRTTPEAVANGSAARYLESQQERLAEVYKEAIDAGSSIGVDRCSVAVSAKDAARIIHFEDYRPFDFAGRLRAIQRGR